MTQFSKGNTKARKLDAEQVIEMRQRYHHAHWTQRRLARHYAVSLNTVANIVNGITWQQLPMPQREISDEEIQAMERRYMEANGLPYKSPAELAYERMQGEIAKAKESSVESQLDKLKGGSK